MAEGFGLVEKERESEMKKRKLSMRTAERVIRAAYDFEDLASRLRAGGHEYYANSLKSISSSLGNIGRQMARDVEDGQR